MAGCKCELCELSKLRREALNSNNIEFVKNTLKEFADLFEKADFDATYYKLILDGNWDSAPEIIAR